jgi:hypothetical protein
MAIGKIACSMRDGRLYAEFLDYPERAQVKDFYKIFKKGSGRPVSSYEETETSVIGISESPDSVRLEWTAVRGCCVSAEKADAAKLVEIATAMLAYRYRGLSEEEMALDTELLSAFIED